MKRTANRTPTASLQGICFVTAALLIMAQLKTNGAQAQPNVSQIAPTISQMGPGWLSNSVIVLIDPLSSPTQVSESPSALKLGRNRLHNNSRLDAFEMVRYFKAGQGHLTNAVVTSSGGRAKLILVIDGGTTKTQRIPSGLCLRLVIRCELRNETGCTTT